MIENFIIVGGLGEVHKILFLLFYFLFLLYLKNRGWGGGGKMLLLLQGWQQVEVL